MTALQGGPTAQPYWRHRRLAVAALGLVALALAVGWLLSRQTDGGPSGSLGEVDGLPVWSVAELIAARDSGQLHGRAAAVAGWFAQAPMHGCAAPRERHGELERYCHKDEEIVSDRPQRLYDPADPGRMIEPVGAFIQPMFVGFSQVPGLGAVDGPQAVVMVGHVGDPLAIRCRPVARAECERAFVVDRVVSLDGRLLGINLWLEPEMLAVPPSLAPEDVERIVVGRVGSGALLVMIKALRARDVVDIDPRPDLDPTGDGTVWYVRIVDRASSAPPFAISTVIILDATGEIRWSDLPPG